MKNCNFETKKPASFLSTLSFIILAALILVALFNIDFGVDNTAILQPSGLRGKTGTVTVDNYQANLRRGKAPIGFIDFVAYLEKVGAENINCNIDCTYDDQIDNCHTLSFSYKGYDYVFKTVEPEKTSYMGYRLYTTIEASNESETIITPAKDSGNYICDESTAYVMDETVYQVFRCITDEDYWISGMFRREKHGTGCPLDGTGIIHYSKKADGSLVTHIDDGPDYYRTKCY